MQKIKRRRRKKRTVVWSPTFLFNLLITAPKRKKNRELQSEYSSAPIERSTSRVKRKEGRQKNPRERMRRRRRRAETPSPGLRWVAQLGRLFGSAALKRSNTDEAIVSDRLLSRASSANRLKRGGAGSQ